MSDSFLFAVRVQSLLNTYEIFHFVHHYHKSEKAHYLFIYVNNVINADYVSALFSHFPEVESTDFGIDEDGDCWVQLNLYKDLF